MNAQQLLLDFLGEIYDSRSRKDFLELLDRMLSPALRLDSGIAFVPFNARTGQFEIEGYETVRCSRNWIEHWLIYYSKLDPVAETIRKNPQERALRYTDVLSAEEHLNSGFLKNFLSTIPATWILALPLLCQGLTFGMVWLMRGESGGEFSEEERDIGTILSHHIAKAFMMQNIRGVPPVDQNPGILVFDHNNLLIWQNDESIRILGSGKTDFGMLGRIGGQSPLMLQTKEGLFQCRTIPVRPASPFCGENPGRVVILEGQGHQSVLCQKMRELDLSKRHSQVVLEVVKGRSNREIAEKLGLTVQTVKDHIHHIFQQLNVRSRAELIVRVLGVIPGPGDGDD